MMQKKRIPEFLEIKEIKVPLTYYYSSRAKLIRFSLNHTGLKVVKPYRISMKTLQKAITEKENWIYKHYKNMIRNKMEIKEKEWITGGSVTYLGKDHNIEIIEQIKKRTTIKFKDDTFYIYIEKDIDREERVARIENAFKQQFIVLAKEHIIRRVQHFKEKTGFKYNEIRIKDQKTIWGSCSKKRNLNFNWKLIMTPEMIIDYIVIHELCHILHMNHSKEYWDTIEKYMPEYKKAKKWLKENRTISF